MRGEENAVSVTGILFHKRAYVCVGNGVETDHRLVQNPKFGIVDKRTHHANLLAHTVGVVVDGIVNSVAETEHLVQFCKTSFSILNAHAVCVCHKVDILNSRKFHKHVVLVAHKPKSILCLDRLFCDIVSVDRDRTLGVGKDARHAFKRS